MLRPSGSAPIVVDARAEPAEDLRADAVGRSVRAVEQDVEPAEIELGEARVQRAQVVLLRAVQRAHPADVARRAPKPGASRSSIASSSASASLKPSPPKNLIPLSRYGLCDAETTAARSKPYWPSSSGAAGVGRTPPLKTSPPAAAMPAASAHSSISPDSRVSRMIRTRGRPPL